MQPLCRQSTARVNRKGQRDNLLIQSISPNLTRESSVLSRMAGRSVGARHDPALAHEILDVLLIHVEGSNRQCSCLLPLTHLDKQCERPFYWTLLSLLRNLGQCTAMEFWRFF